MIIINIMREKNIFMENDQKARIDLFIDHLENAGVLERTPNGLRIYADKLVFGTAKNEDPNAECKMGVLFALRSDTAKIEFVHVIESKELLKKLRNTIDQILREEISVEVV